MTNKISFIFFWLLFLGLFLLFFMPKPILMANGFPHYSAILNTGTKKIIFIVHILSGVIVYITAFLQFAPFIRNRHIRFHRMTGKLYVAASLICIATLYYIISLFKTMGPFSPSQYIATTLWLIFIALALYFVRKRKILWHRRFMISGFICAAYFVSVRVIDRYCMGIFKSIIKEEGTALLVSDVFVWAVPLMICWTYWMLKTKPGLTVGPADAGVPV